MAATERKHAGGVSIRRMAPAMGAEVTGIDTAKPLDGATRQLITDAFQEHHVLVFPGQDLSAEQQIDFSLQFGDLEVFPEEDKTDTGPKVYHVANVSTDGRHLAPDDDLVTYQKVNARWHTDSSYRYIPALASIMYGVEVLPDEAEGGETEFSNLFMAYDALSEEMKERLAPLHMVHYYEFGRRLFPQLPPVTPAERQNVPPVSHPVIRVHPDRNYRRALFFTTNAGNEISGMSLEEGQALHKELARHISEARFCYKHRWRAGDLVMWDNRCLLHQAVAFDVAKYRRIMRRTTVAGDGAIIGPFSAEARRA